MYPAYYAPRPAIAARTEPPPVVWVLASMGLMALLGAMVSTVGAVAGLVVLAAN